MQIPNQLITESSFILEKSNLIKDFRTDVSRCWSRQNQMLTWKVKPQLSSHCHGNYKNRNSKYHKIEALYDTIVLA